MRRLFAAGRWPEPSEQDQREAQAVVAALIEKREYRAQLLAERVNAPFAFDAEPEMLS